MALFAHPIPEDWRSRYAQFLDLDQTRAALRHDDSEAFFVAYPRVVNDGTPVALLKKPLAQARIGVITTGGIHLPQQTPFRSDHMLGDCSARLFSADLSHVAWSISHGHYDETAARQDLNVVLPLDPLRALVDDGVIGSLAARAGSIDGYCTDAGGLLDDAGQTLLESMRQDGADALLMVPV